MASIPRVASNALLAALGIVVDALIVVETLPSETVEDRHTFSFLLRSAKKAQEHR